MDELMWLAIGAAAVVIVEASVYFYWIIWGNGYLITYINDSQRPQQNFKVLQTFHTSTQKIALVEVGEEVWVYSNGEIMFGTKQDENEYAEVIVHVPMAAAKEAKRILIIGGGGGISVREALRYEEVEEIIAVDIDEEMMNLGKSFDRLVSFNDGALNHHKVKTKIEDGRRFVEQSQETWDVIIVDIPEPTERCPSLSRLFSLEFYHELKEHLNPGGVLSIACSTVNLMPEYMWSIEKTLKECGFFTSPFHNFSNKTGVDWGYILASTLPLEPDDIQLKVTTPFLTEGRLRDVLELPYYLMNKENQGMVQTDQNTVLLDIVRKELNN
ncbi:spermidine synthase [Fictibacillus nanhaiensis]|uniref:Polyamine aminopropyltransferase n=1 Tax=Fictibacillus nanhaiensis TaxID=742169 RepID=A0ABS2ZM91_9BACL|nr:spermidine synthase [Fictibacillus nanhaiensis]